KFNIGPLAKALHLVCAVRQRTQVLHLTHRQLSPLRPCTYIEMAAIDWLPVVRAGMVSMWIELSFMIFFALGFVLLRNGVFSFLGPGNAKKGDYGKSSRRAAQFSSKSKKIIEAEASRMETIGKALTMPLICVAWFWCQIIHTPCRVT
ncbi:unnamed protein product, partial [Effrenium voratum]